MGYVLIAICVVWVYAMCTRGSKCSRETERIEESIEKARVKHEQ